jgi:hypothetical protein
MMFYLYKLSWGTSLSFYLYSSPPKERPPLLYGHFFIAEGVALKQGDYWINDKVGYFN